MFKITDKEIAGDISAGTKVFVEAKKKLERVKEKIHKYQEQKAAERAKLAEQIGALNTKIMVSNLDSASADLHMERVVSTIGKIDSLVGQV